MSMQRMPAKEETERDYRAGYERVMWFARRAKLQGWHFTDRQLVHEILQREHAARVREKSSLPMIGPGVRSAAWNRGQADALRDLLRDQHEEK